MLAEDAWYAADLAEKFLDALPHAHLVACSYKKVPIHRGWIHTPSRREDFDLAKLVGVIPASVGLVVVDCDYRGYAKEAVAALGAPLARVKTLRPHGEHLLYRSPDPPARSRKWGGGDIRGERGLAIVWELEPWLLAAAKAPAAQAPALSDLTLRKPWE